jgi:predicted nucleotidyltransferase
MSDIASILYPSEQIRDRVREIALFGSLARGEAIPAQ